MILLSNLPVAVQIAMTDMSPLVVSSIDQTEPVSPCSCHFGVAPDLLLTLDETSETISNEESKAEAPLDDKGEDRGVFQQLWVLMTDQLALLRGERPFWDDGVRGDDEDVASESGSTAATPD